MRVVIGLEDFDGFDWDEANLEHATRHGISREQLENAVKAGFSVHAYYERNEEFRYSASTTAEDGTPIEFAFTIRNRKIRPITAHKVKRSKRKRS